jgi:sugar phosphate isomerase/epimerase
MKLDEFALAPAAWPGALETRLEALAAAGFGQVALEAEDLAGHVRGFEGALRAVRASGLRVAAFGTLQDFEGLAGAQHDHQVGIAKAFIEMAAALGTGVLTVRSSTRREASAAPGATAHDLQKLALLAIPHGLKIAYGAGADGRHVRRFLQASKLVFDADMPNLGLALDASDIAAAGEDLEDLELLDPLRLHAVQLSDGLWSEAGGDRVFPGEGADSEALVRLVVGLDRLGYAGAYTLAASGADLRRLPLAVVAERARQAAVWLAEDVLQRSVPLAGAPRLRVAQRVD